MTEYKFTEGKLYFNSLTAFYLWATGVKWFLSIDSDKVFDRMANNFLYPD